MLPDTFEKLLPKIYERNNSSSKTALINFMNTLIAALKNDILNLRFLINPVICPSTLLDELGYWLEAGINPGDSEDLKRKKISDSISTHKVRSTWIFDVKIKIDNYVGGDSSIFVSVSEGTWRFIGDGTTPTGHIYASLGGDGINTDWGLRLGGSGSDIWDKGSVRIDVDSSTLTSDQVEELKLEIEDSIPCYFIAYLGYLVAGSFVSYPNGQIT